MSQEHIHYRTCNLCEAMCGIEIRYTDDKINSIKGDKNDPFSQGHICPKAVALQDLHYDPDRLKKPLRKHGDTYLQISWSEAIDETAHNINKIQNEFGADSVGVYYGNPLAHNHSLLLFSGGFFEVLKSKNRFSPTSVDQLPHMLVAKEMFGNQLLLPVADVDRTDYLICIGANPLASMGSLMTAPDMKGKLKSIKARGGKVIVIDPRRTETAEAADAHYFIKPGTDLFLIAAMLGILFKKDFSIPRHLEHILDDASEIKKLVSHFTLEQASQVTGIPAAIIETMTTEFIQSKTALLYSRIGTCAQQYGTLTNWLIVCFNILTGNFERPGGLMFTLPALDIAGVSSLFGQTGSFDSYRSRVSNLPEFNQEFPAVTMAEEILTPGEGKIRGLVTLAGNPVLSTPNGRQVDTALKSLDFMVSLDLYRNETTCHADIILPGTGQLEHSHFDPLFNLLAVRNTVKFSPALFEPEEGAMHDWEILRSLCSSLLRKKNKNRIANRFMAKVVDTLDPDELLDRGIRMGPYGSLVDGKPLLKSLTHNMAGASFKKGLAGATGLLSRFSGSATHAMKTFSLLQEEKPHEGLSLNKIMQHPHGIDLGPLQASFPARLATKNKKVILAPDVFTQELRRIIAGFNSASSLNTGKQPATADNQELVLIGRRDIRSCNSWMHNSYRLVKGKNRCTMLIHPEDAETRNITDKNLVKVSSRVGSIEIAAEITESIMPGTISIPHGWGHDRKGVQLQTASKHAGVSVNDITDETLYENLTGMAVLNGGLVKVVPVESSSQTSE